MAIKIPIEIKSAFEEAMELGVHCRLESGKKHHKMYVNNRMVGVVSLNFRATGKRGFKNIIAIIRRESKRELQQREETST